MFNEGLFKLLYIVYIYILKESVSSAVKNCNLLLNRHRRVLRLNKQTGVLSSLVYCLSGNLIHLTAKLCKGLKFLILRLVYLKRTGNLLHRFYLSVTTYTGNGDTYVDCRTVTLVEEISIKEDLSVCNGDYIGWNISGNVTLLSLNNRKRSKRTASFNFTLKRIRQVIHLLCNLLLINYFCSSFQKS